MSRENDQKNPDSHGGAGSNAIPCMVLTFSEKELAFVKLVLESEGYEDNLKDWILDTMQGDNTDENDEGRYDGAADRVIKNMSEFIRNNPDTIHAVGNLANSLVGNLLRRVKERKGPQG